MCSHKAAQTAKPTLFEQTICCKRWRKSMHLQHTHMYYNACQTMQHSKPATTHQAWHNKHGAPHQPTKQVTKQHLQPNRRDCSRARCPTRQLIISCRQQLQSPTSLVQQAMPEAACLLASPSCGCIKDRCCAHSP